MTFLAIPQETLPPSEYELCCCCHTSNVELYAFGDGRPPRRHQHCQLCYMTFAGNTCVWPATYDLDTAMIMQHVNMVANLMLLELKK